MNQHLLMTAAITRARVRTNPASATSSVRRAPVEHVRAYAAGKGWHVLDEHVYVDDGMSGATIWRKRHGCTCDR